MAGCLRPHRDALGHLLDTHTEFRLLLNRQGGFTVQSCFGCLDLQWTLGKRRPRNVVAEGAMTTKPSRPRSEEG